MNDPYQITTNVIAEYQRPSGYINVHGANQAQTLAHVGDSIVFQDNNMEYELLYNYEDPEIAELILLESKNRKRGEGIKKITIYKPQNKEDK